MLDITKKRGKKKINRKKMREWKEERSSSWIVKNCIDNKIRKIKSGSWKRMSFQTSVKFEKEQEKTKKMEFYSFSISIDTDSTIF